MELTVLLLMHLPFDDNAVPCFLRVQIIRDRIRWLAKYGLNGGHRAVILLGRNGKEVEMC